VKEQKRIDKGRKCKVDLTGLSTELQLVQHYHMLPIFSSARAQNKWSWWSLNDRHKARTCGEKQKPKNLPLLRSIFSKFSPYSAHF